MKHPSLSLVIPTYNSKDLLQKCLLSLEKQDLNAATSNIEESTDSMLDFSCFEVIVIDDGSTDGTMEMLEIFQKTSKFQLKKQHIANIGPAGARNLGVSLAKGSWVGFMDADVTAHSHWIQKGMELIHKHPESGAFEGKTEICNREQMTPFTHQTSNDGGRYLTCNLIVRKELCHFYPQYRIPFREDSDMAFCILESGFRILFDAELLCYHPPLNPTYSRPFKLAQRYYYDGLLRRRFPERYRKELDARSFRGIRIANLKKKLFAGILAAQCVVILSILLLPWSAIPLLISGSVYAIGTGLGIWGLLRSFQTSLNSQDLWVFCKQMQLLPLSLYRSLLQGTWRFRKEARFSPEAWKKQFAVLPSSNALPKS